MTEHDTHTHPNRAFSSKQTWRGWVGPEAGLPFILPKLSTQVTVVSNLNRSVGPLPGLRTTLVNKHFGRFYGTESQAIWKPWEVSISFPNNEL